MALGAVVQAKTAVCSASNWTSGSASGVLSFDATCTAGNLLLCIQSRNDDAVALVAPSGGWTAGPSHGTSGSSASLAGGVYWKKSDGNETGVTLSWVNETQPGQVLFVEIDATGLDLDSVHQNDDATITAVTAHDTGTVTLDVADGYIVVGFVCDNVTGGRYVGSFSDSFNEIASGAKSSGNAVPQLAAKTVSSAGPHGCVGTWEPAATDQGWGCVLGFDMLPGSTKKVIRPATIFRAQSAAIAGSGSVS